MPALLEYLDLICFDVDGTLTDGRKMYDRRGKICGKTFYDRDLSSLYRIREAGVNVVFISGDNKVGPQVAREMDIPFLWVPIWGDKNKLERLKEVEPDLSTLKWAHVGDGVSDLPLLIASTYPFCPASATRDVIRCVDQRWGKIMTTSEKPSMKRGTGGIFNIETAGQIPRRGGHGVVEEMFYRLQDLEVDE